MLYLKAGRFSPRRGLWGVEASTCVLVVDDDEAIRDTMRLVLEDAGYRVEGVADGVAALDRMRTTRERYIVLLDLVMPGMDGTAVLADVAADTEIATRHVYILMTAAQARLTAAVQDTLARLNVPILYKPFDLDVLLALVGEAAARLVANEGASRHPPLRQDSHQSLTSADRDRTP